MSKTRWLAIGNRAYSNKADLRRLGIEPAKAGFAVVDATCSRQVCKTLNRTRLEVSG
jgi:hypothetical protein